MRFGNIEVKKLTQCKLQIVIAGAMVQMKVRSTKNITGKRSGKACFILKENPVTQRSYLKVLTVCGHWLL